MYVFKVLFSFKYFLFHNRFLYRTETIAVYVETSNFKFNAQNVGPPGNYWYLKLGNLKNVIIKKTAGTYLYPLHYDIIKKYIVLISTLFNKILLKDSLYMSVYTSLYYY